MPYSGTQFDNITKNFVLNKYGRNYHILDVGAGAGKYGVMFKDHFDVIDAIEIYEPYIKQFNISDIYNRVLNIDVMEFEDFDKYQIFLLGDILQHLSVTNARLLLSTLQKHAELIIVQVPYCYQQGIYMGNVHQIHLQSDLTYQNMKERYPELKCLIRDNQIGVYYWSRRILI